MILSRRFGFIFIKGRKVGGTSLEMALSTLCGPADIVTPITPVDEQQRLRMGGRPANYAATRAAEETYVAKIESTYGDALAALRAPPGPYFNHMPLSAVLELAPGAREFRVVFIERNPYAKILSWANMVEGFDAYRGGASMAGDIDSVCLAANRAVSDGSMLRVRNIDLYRDDAGIVAASALRHESLAEDFARMVRRLGIEDVPALPHAKRGLLSDRFDPRDIFRREALDAINVAFADEFMAFGYQQL